MIWRCRDFQIDLQKPIVMGILNLTPDSFSDGGRFTHTRNNTEHFEIDVHQVLESAKQMILEGAEILDIGGESTRPNAVPVREEEELNRVIPVISALTNHVSFPISVDTTKSVVAEKALEAGASIINDISGFRKDSNMPKVCRKFQSGVVLMHSTELPERMKWSYDITGDSGHIVTEVKKGLQESLSLASQIEKDRIVIDPGFGFSKSVDGNFKILHSLEILKELGFPLMIGLSRKSFLGKVISSEGEVAAPLERDYATSAAHFYALQQGAMILRAHHVKAASDTIKVFCKLRETNTAFG